jgi:hypothetical protein
MDEYRKPGFTIPGYAAAAARKGQELRLLRRWTPEEARALAPKAAEARWSEHRDPKELRWR